MYITGVMREGFIWIKQNKTSMTRDLYGLTRPSVCLIYTP